MVCKRFLDTGETGNSDIGCPISEDLLGGGSKMLHGWNLALLGAGVRSGPPTSLLGVQLGVVGILSLLGVQVGGVEGRSSSSLTVRKLKSGHLISKLQLAYIALSGY